MGIDSIIAAYLVSALLFFVGVFTIVKGTKSQDLALLNYGLVMLAFLIASRFIDGEISFVVRGVLFILIGLAFFGVNYIIIKNRRESEK